MAIQKGIDRKCILLELVRLFVVNKIVVFLKMIETEVIIQKFPVLFFDDTCLLCNRAVQFILNHEKRISFYFASIRSSALTNIPGLSVFSGEFDSVMLLHCGKVYLYSDAVLQTARLMGFPWNLAAIFYLMPRAVRNNLYRWIALHRHQWFGKADTCIALTGKFRGRLLAITHNS